MARYIGPKCRLSRREGIDLQHKSRGVALSSKCKIDVPPGQFGDRAGGKKASDYSVQLRMKQLIKRYYGVLEKQFHNYYKKADRQKGASGENLIRLLESRLDNVVYRMGFAATRAEARQLVSHRSVAVNGKRVNIPSYLVAADDEISICENSKGQLRITGSLELAAANGVIPEWLSVDDKKKLGVFKRAPDLNEFPPEFKVHLVVELYSK